MFSVGLKNAILVCLLILILHFTIKNIMFDKGSKKESFKTSEEPPPQCRFYDNNDKKDLETEKKQMLEYVMGDPEDLDKYFKGNPVTEVAKNQQCAPKTDDNTLPLSTTCDPSLTQVNLGESMKVKANCDLPQDKKNVMLLKEYENEKPLNGGELYGGITAYDSLDLYFSTP